MSTSAYYLNSLYINNTHLTNVILIPDISWQLVISLLELLYNPRTEIELSSLSLSYALPDGEWKRP